MNAHIRNVLLFIVVVGIILAIYYLESQKVSLPSSASAANDTIDLNSLVDTSTDTSSTTDTSIHASSTTGMKHATPPRTPDFAQLAAQYPVAKELVSPDGYINTQGQPITIKSLIGKKVVLLDFWTYSCINCQRTIPYLNAWYAKYKDLGLEIIGIQSPEFQFEKNIDNVQAAVTKFGMKYPVVLDNEMQTWNAYGNEYWPEEYMIDINGLVVDRNIGEGNYDKTEHTIQKLLQERSLALGLNLTIPSDLVDVTAKPIEANSPETYFGSARNEYLANGTQNASGLQTLADPVTASIEPNQLYLGGSWNFQDQFATNQSADAHIFYQYDAQHVYFVASADQNLPAGQAGVSITVLRDGVPLTTDRGTDVDVNGNATINQSRLYDLIDQPSMSSHTLEIIVHNPGLQAYTFTFG